MIWRCKHVAEALAERHVEELSLGQRIALRIHVALCIVCGRYHRQVMAMQEVAGRLRQREQAGDLAGPGLDVAARDRLLAAVRTAAERSGSGEKT